MNLKSNANLLHDDFDCVLFICYARVSSDSRDELEQDVQWVVLCCTIFRSVDRAIEGQVIECTSQSICPSKLQNYPSCAGEIQLPGTDNDV